MPPSSSSGSSLRDFVEAGFRRKGTVLGTIVVVLLLVVLWTLLSGRRYESEMKILVQNARGAVVLSGGAMATGAVTAQVTEEQINSELEVLHSRDVLDDVADAGWSSVPIAQRTAEEIQRHDRRLTLLNLRLGAEVARKSNVITVTYQGDTPEQSQNTLRQLQSAFLDKEKSLERPVGATQFFEQEAERYREAWDDATRKLVAFQQEHGILALPDDQASSEKSILALRDQERTLEVSESELRGRIAAGSQSLRRMSPRETTAVRALPNQQSAQELSTLLVTLENKRTALLTAFLPTDRAVLEVDRQIGTTREALATARNTTAAEQTTDINPVWQQMLNHIAQDEVALKSIRQQKQAVEQQLAAQQRRLSSGGNLTVQYNQLKSRADEAKENYTGFAQKKDQGQIEDALDARQLLNVTIAESPTYSTIPVQPKPLRNLFFGFVTACFLSLALLYLLELGRTTVITPRELEEVSPHLVLATVPVGANGLAGVYANHERATTAQELLQHVLVPCAGTGATRPARPHSTYRAAESTRLQEGFLRQTLTGMSHNRKDGLVIALTSVDPRAGVGFLTNILAEKLGQENQGSVYCMSAAVLQEACEQAEELDAATLARLERAVAPPARTQPAVWHDSRTLAGMILTRLRAEYQYVFVTCPALAQAQSALAVAPLADSIIIVVEADRTQARQVQVLERTLEAVGGKIAGYILNKRSYAIPKWLYARLSGARL